MFFGSITKRMDDTSFLGIASTSRHDDLRRNVVSPGYVHSELVDPYVEAVPDLMKALVSRYSAMNRLGQGHEIAAGVAWLCSDAASFVNGAVPAMDGGDTTRLY